MSSRLEETIIQDNFEFYKKKDPQVCFVNAFYIAVYRLHYVKCSWIQCRSARHYAWSSLRCTMHVNHVHRMNYVNHAKLVNHVNHDSEQHTICNYSASYVIRDVAMNCLNEP